MSVYLLTYLLTYLLRLEEPVVSFVRKSLR